MKKVLLFTALAAALTASFAQANEKLVVAATPIPHAEILELVKPTLAKEGVDLEIKVSTATPIRLEPSTSVITCIWPNSATQATAPNSMPTSTGTKASHA